jgi:16S rRNA (cytidine1402-2'-O)-methyltransferase
MFDRKLRIISYHRGMNSICGTVFIEYYRYLVLFIDPPFPQDIILNYLFRDIGIGPITVFYIKTFVNCIFQRYRHKFWVACDNYYTNRADGHYYITHIYKYAKFDVHQLFGILFLGLFDIGIHRGQSGDYLLVEIPLVLDRLNKYDIKKPLIPLNEFNEEQTVYAILGKLAVENVAIVSDAGTPLISDPGYKLVLAAKKKGFNIIPIPGASAIITALSAAALPTDRFTFLGFLPKTPSKALRSLELTRPLESTVILYESPHRLLQTLKNIEEVFGDIEITIARELTKKFEEITSQKVSEVLRAYATKNPKGEFTILFSTK